MWKKFKRDFAPYILYFIVKFIYFTNKKVYHHPKNDDKKPFIIISRNIKAMPAQYNKYQGFPYHKTAQLISCTGFTKALYVRLNNNIITLEEKKEIKSLFQLRELLK